MGRIAGFIVIVLLLFNGSHAGAPSAHAGGLRASAAPAPLVLAPASVTVSPGPQAGGTLLGAVIFSSFGSTSTASADIYLGIVPTSTTPYKNRVNLHHNTSTPSTNVKSGDCWGDWDKVAPNAFAMAYEPASSDRLTVTLSGTRVLSEVNCSLVFSNFTKLVSDTHGAGVAQLVPLMNYLEIAVKRNSTNYTSTLANLALNESIALGMFNPVTTTTAISHAASVHLGDGFKLAGAINLAGNFSNCAGTCEIEIRFGAAPAQLVVQKQISGIAPADDWQFSGPKGAFTLPAFGGTTVITPLGSNTYVISETTKHGFSSSAACTNGANGGNSVSVTPSAGETITCTFASSALPSDLAISKEVVSDSVQVGSTITYALVVSNAGAGPAYHAVITDRVPPSLTVIAAQSSIGNCTLAGNDITCDAGFIDTSPISAPVTVIVTTTAPSDDSAIGLTITNTAGVTDALDATPANNTAERAITLRAVDAGQIVVRNVVNGMLPASGAFGYALQTPLGEMPFTLSAGGNVTFAGMMPGAYGVSATAPMGYATSVACDGSDAGAFTLNAGGTVTCTVTHAGANTLAGMLWHDRNENAQIDTDEWRLPQVTVALSGTLAGGGVSALTTTDSSGAYAFAGLPDGAFVVAVLSETLPAGVVTPTYDADGAATPHTAQTSLCCNAPATLNFGYQGDGRIGGRVFFDVNNDGALSEGDLPLANSIVALNGDFNNDSALEVVTATTNSAGGYAFASILSGVYTLTVDGASLPAGLLPSTPLSVVMALGDAPVLDVNFGFRGSGSIAGVVWEDANGDGAAGADEPGLDASLMLEGDLNRDGVLDVLRTSAVAGAYAFAHLVAGVYTVSVDAASLPPAMQPIAQAWRVEMLAQDEAKENVNIGFVRPASIAGKVWLDGNRNGALDEGERGINGINVALFDAASAGDALAIQNVTASPIAAATTDAQGKYGFAQLMPGRRYMLNFALPAGYAWAIGDGSAIDPNGNTGVFTVMSGAQTVLQINAGATLPTRVILQKTTQQTMLGADARITYTLIVRNAGETLAAQTLISDPLPSALAFVSAAPWPSLPPADGTALVWAIGDLPAGQSFTVTLVTQLKPNAPLAGSTIVNTAYALGDAQSIARTNDLQSSATTVLQPSAITLASFNATLEGNGVRLAWRTLLEQNTFGFHVLRSATGSRADAQRVNADIIPAGANDYTLFDAEGAVNSVYWLQEIELDGEMRDAGPFRVSAPAVAAPAQQAIAQPVLVAQPAPVFAAMDMSTQAVALPEARFSAPAQAAVMPQMNAPAPAHAASVQATQPAGKATAPSTVKATAAMDPPAMVVTPAPATPFPAAQTTPMPQPPSLDALGMLQVISVQRGNATPQATAEQGDAPRDVSVSFPAILLLSALGLSGLMLLAMGLSDIHARRRDGRR